MSLSSYSDVFAINHDREYDEEIQSVVRDNRLGALTGWDPGFAVAAKADSFWQLLLLHGALGDRFEAELLSYEALRCPTLGDRDVGAQEDPRAALENDLFLRLADVEDVLGILDVLFAEFCTVRGSKAWTATELPTQGVRIRS